MRHLGVDHGTKRIGLAISDETGTLARPLTAITHKSRADDAARVAAAASEHAVGGIVVGLPTDAEGQPGAQARHVMRFADALRRAASIEVTLWDESYSSVRAATIAARKKKRAVSIDAIAAAVILQDYLDAQAHTVSRANDTE